MTLSYGQGMAIMRIGFGLYFWTQAYSKLTAGWLESPKTLLESQIGPAVQRGTAESFFRPFLENVVQPNAPLFAQLVPLGEVLVAALLILGLLTRVGCIGGGFLVLNYMTMKGFL